MTATFVLRHPPGYEAERRYIYELLLEDFLGQSARFAMEDRTDVEIRLSGAPSNERLLVADVLFAMPLERWLTQDSMPRRPLPRVSVDQLGLARGPVVDPLPALYGEGEPMRTSGTEHRLGIDVFGSSFFLLTRYEEVVSETRDPHDRFPAQASILGQERLLDRPLVNEYAEALWSALARLWPRLERRPRRMTVRLSHDVDLPVCRLPLFEARRLGLRDLRREHAPMVAARRFATAALKGRVPPRHDLYQTFDLLMRESEALGLRSAFYFMAGNTAGAIDGNYRLDEPWVRPLLREIHGRGHEIGLHPSYNTYQDPEALRSEFQKLRAACALAAVEQERLGGRQHYLRWRNPETWQNWEDAGLDYDSTVSFADHPGFRAGTCYEYPVFNLTSRRRLKLRERPLIVMEAALLEYQRLTLDEAAEEIIRLSAIVRRFGGDMTLLWHNDRLLSRRARRAYRRAISGSVRGAG